MDIASCRIPRLRRYVRNTQRSVRAGNYWQWTQPRCRLLAAQRVIGNALNADPALDFDGNQRFRLNQRECSAIHSPTDQPLLVDELSIATQGWFRGEINNLACARLSLIFNDDIAHRNHASKDASVGGTAHELRQMTSPFACIQMPAHRSMVSHVGKHWIPAPIK